MGKFFIGFKGRSKGAALTEYGILVGLIAVLSIVGVLSLGNTVNNTFSMIANTLSTNTALANNQGNQAVVEEAASGQLASISIVVGDIDAALAGFADEHGYVRTPAYTVNVGSLISQTSEVYEIQSIHTQGFSGHMRLNVVGDLTAVDLTGIELTCDHFPISYPLSAPTNPMSYNATNDTTFFLWTPSGGTFSVGNTVSCTIDQN